MNHLRSTLLIGLLLAGCGGVIADPAGDARGPLGVAGSAPVEPDGGVAGTGAAPGPTEGAGSVDQGTGGSGSGSAAPGGAGSGVGGSGVAGAGSVDPGVGGSGVGGSTPWSNPWGGGCGAASYPTPAPPAEQCQYEHPVDSGYPEGEDPFAGGGCPCSRRLPSDPLHCPDGDGVAHSIVVGPEGGVFTFASITYSGVPFRLSFPPGAVAAATEVQVTAQGAPPGDFQDYSPLIRLAPADLVLAAPVAVDLGYEIPDATGGGYINKNLALQVSIGETGCFRPAEGAYLNAGFVQGKIGSFGALFAGHLKPASVASCP